MAIAMNFTIRNIINLILRFLQFVGAISCIVYYGRDLNSASRVDGYSDGKWVFAVVVASMAAISAVVFAILSTFVEYRAVSILWIWDVILMFLWVVVTGIFATMYFDENTEMDQGIYDMKVAAGFDLANFLLWLITGALGAWSYFTGDRPSLYTGRANSTRSKRSTRSGSKKSGGLKERFSRRSKM